MKRKSARRRSGAGRSTRPLDRHATAARRAGSQVYGFNTKADAVLASSSGQVAERERSTGPFAQHRGAERASTAGGHQPRQRFAGGEGDESAAGQVILITDGLPTQGKSAGFRKYIDAGARARLFDDAVAELPEKVPVDVVLLPMKGDLPAAHRFWQLSRFTKGTLLMPSKDWP